MSKRQLSNWIESYMEYTQDGFVPEQFHYWSGLQLIAAMTERKTFLPWNSYLSFYPNIYTLLVAPPGVGKSSAINVSMHLLREVKKRGGKIHLISNKITEAQFVDEMSIQGVYEAKKPDGGIVRVFHCSGFFVASEASNTLKNAHGDLTDMLTDFYDCPPLFKKATKTSGDALLTNVCMNVTAGCTFNYLNELLTSEGIDGGFASRFIYVICEERPSRIMSWQNEKTRKADTRKLEQSLIQDLLEINKVVGAFTADKEYIALWEEWANENERILSEEQNEQLEALNTRKDMAVKKVSMLLSLSESSELVLRGKHFKEAHKLVDQTFGSISRMLDKIAAQDFDGRVTRKNIDNQLTPLLRRGYSEAEILRTLVTKFNESTIKETLREWKKLGLIRLNDRGRFELLNKGKSELLR